MSEPLPDDWRLSDRAAETVNGILNNDIEWKAKCVRESTADVAKQYGISENELRKGHMVNGMKHSPEPWEYDDRRSLERFDHRFGIFVADNLIIGEHYGGPGDRFFAGRECDLRRAVACVNALAGIDDPAAWVAQAKETLKSAEDARRRSVEASKMVCELADQLETAGLKVQFNRGPSGVV